MISSSGDKNSEQRVKALERKWINDHSISYTFHGDEFMPNPDSKFFEEWNIQDYKIFPIDEL
jgi:hypothetical protein